MFDVWLRLIFGVIGDVLKKLEYPLAPLVLALVLGDRAEDAFRQTMLMSQGELNVFWSNGLVGTIMALAVVILVWPMFGSLLEKTRRRKVVSAHQGASE